MPCNNDSREIRQGVEEAAQGKKPKDKCSDICRTGVRNEHASLIHSSSPGTQRGEASGGGSVGAEVSGGGSVEGGVSA